MSNPYSMMIIHKYTYLWKYTYICHKDLYLYVFLLCLSKAVEEKNGGNGMSFGESGFPGVYEPFGGWIIGTHCWLWITFTHAILLKIKTKKERKKWCLPRCIHNTHVFMYVKIYHVLNIGFVVDDGVVWAIHIYFFIFGFLLYLVAFVIAPLPCFTFPSTTAAAGVLFWLDLVEKGWLKLPTFFWWRHYIKLC